ncbi:24375_t:CDS:1, partial [Cetraspora pellucida]
MKSIKYAVKKVHDFKKPLAYIDTLMKNSKLWIHSFTKISDIWVFQQLHMLNYCRMLLNK